jgi:serine/threonine-protein kinase
LQRCLEKDPNKRLRDISGVGLLLEEPAAPAQARTSRLAWSAAGTLAVVAIVALWAPWHRTRTSARALVRLDVDLGPEVSLDPGSPQGAGVIISPDGHRLVWASRGRLFTRRLDQPKALELAGTQGASSAFFSPDGQWVGFFAGGKLRKVSVEGGAALTLCDAPQGRGGTWGEDGRIVASLNGNTLSTISDSGGLPAPLTELSQGDPQHRWPQILPGERAVLFTARSSSPLWDEASIDVVSLVDRRRKTLQRGGMFGRYVATGNGDGYLVYVNKSTLYAAPFDVSRLEIRGAPVVVLEDVAYNNVNGAAQFDLSRTGTVVYRSLAAGTLVSLQWLDANGNTQALPAKPAVYLYPRLSHDGKLLAVAIAGAGGQDIWIYDWQRDAMSRVTFGGTAYANQVWSPDGRFIVFRGGGGMFWTRADGAGAPQRLTQSQNPQDPGSFSPDGKRLAFTEFPMSGGDIWTVPIEHDGSALKAGKPEPFLQTPASEMFPAFSPDGRWIAYRTFESGISQIQLRAFPDKGGKSLISNNGGVVPVWSPNGRELFYRTEDQHIMVVSYTVKGDVFTGDKPRVWSAKAMAESSTQNPQNLDIAPDGKRFVTLMPVDAPANQQTQNRVVFLENFADELRRRVGAAK